jgi:cyclophilin family peptidyl-prolyl cis-trans isomerase
MAGVEPAPLPSDSCFTSDSTITVNRPIDFSTHKAYARDAAGNVSAALPYTLDMVSPSVLSVTLGLPASGQVPVTATAVDSVGVTGLCLRSDVIEPTATDACFVATTAAFSVSHTFSLAAPTTATTLRVYARDADGRVSLGSPLSLGYCAAGTVGILPKVCFVTTLGEFVMELDNVRAPISANNVLRYVDDGFYTDTQFHRIMSSFMVQGGGFTAAGVAKTPTYAAITLEKTTTTGLSNTAGTVAMARTSVLNSGTSQFFINVVDNTSKLDSTSSNDGYAVFGKIVAGMDTTVQLIRGVPVYVSGGELSKPTDSPRILRATRLR